MKHSFLLSTVHTDIASVMKGAFRSTNKFYFFLLFCLNCFFVFVHWYQTCFTVTAKRLTSTNCIDIKPLTFVFNLLWHNLQVRISSSSGEIEMKLKLRHSVGVTRDSSSIFAFAITLSMTISSLPHIIFTFMTEGGIWRNPIEFAFQVVVSMTLLTFSF